MPSRIANDDEMNLNRYSRQTVYREIGEQGQQKLLRSKVAIVGMGALGTVAANSLARAGVGFLRLIDRDYVELSNLQRQTLYDENDATRNSPKAVAACRHLANVNSEITLEPIVEELDSGNIERLFDGIDLVLDGLDNWESRFLLNESCHKLVIPWIYCAAIGSQGMTMNIRHTEMSPCLQCIVPPDADSNNSPSCATAGVLNMVTGMIAAVQAAEAVKILVDSPQIREGLFVTNLWNNQFKTMPFAKNDDCPVCVHGRYEYLTRTKSTSVKRLCGRNSIQVTPSKPARLELATFAETLKKSGQVEVDSFMLQFDDGRHRILLFPDGRAIIENAIDEMNAKSLYTEYIGGL